MGNNSVFDDIGIGASDLGFAKDPDKVRAQNEAAAAAEEKKRAAEKKQAETDAQNQRDEERRAAPRSRAVTNLTGGQGVSDEELNISRRTLLGR